MSRHIFGFEHDSIKPPGTLALLGVFAACSSVLLMLSRRLMRPPPRVTRAVAPVAVVTAVEPEPEPALRRAHIRAYRTGARFMQL